MFSVLFVSTSRASLEIIDASSFSSGGFQVEAAERATGYDVVFVSDVQFELFVSVSQETPCAASFHQPYAEMPRREIAGAMFEFACDAFSASVIRETRSAALSAGE